MVSPRFASLASVVLLLSACASPPAPAQVRPHDLLVVGTPAGETALDWADGHTVYQTPHGVATPDWSRVVVTSDTGLSVLDGRTGLRQAQIDIPGGLTASAISVDGHRVALAPARPGPLTDTWQPAGRTSTRIVVADPSGAVEPRTFDLTGNYEPDAFASDDEHLFVLEYQPPQAPDSYRVRRLDLKTGGVSATLSRTKEAVPEENMRGTRGMHVLSPDHSTLYTLYTHQPSDLDPASMTSSFVHVLSLSEGWAYCLDLPQPIGSGSASANSLALSRDGATLYVSDRASGSVARIDTGQLIVQATTSIGADPDGASGVAASRVGPDGYLYLSGGSDVLVLSPQSLSLVRRLPSPAATGGLGLSDDGQRLFLSTGDSIVALDPLTGAELGRVSAPGTERIEHVGTSMS